MIGFTCSDNDDTENLRLDIFATREECIAAGRAEYGPEATLYVWHAAHRSATRYLPTAATILERMNESAFDDVGEWVDDWPDLGASSAAEIDLDLVLTEWAKRHEEALAPRFWVTDGEPEVIAGAAGET